MKERNYRGVNGEKVLDRWGIKLGKHALSADPNEQYEDMVPIPSSPHIFFTNNLTLVSMRKEGKVELKEVMVMLAHGDIFGKKHEWRVIGTNKSVTQTVKAYNEVARDMSWSSVDVVLVCRGISLIQMQRKLKEEANIKTRTSKTGGVFNIKMPFVSSLPPQIYPGPSGVEVGGVWEKGKGVLWVSASAIEWQGIEAWQKYWQDRRGERSRMHIPDWAKNKT